MQPVAEPAITIRLAGPADITTLVELRLALFRDLGSLAADDPARPLAAAIRAYLTAKMTTPLYAAWLAELAGSAIAAASIVFLEKLPSVHNPSGLEAYLMSVYTRPEHRRKGAAEALVRTAMAFVQGRGVPRLSLHASVHGRPLYERLGFEALGSEMRWLVPPVEGRPA